MKYFISDFHFCHANIMKYERWNFKNMEEHDDRIFECLEKLKKDDELYFLGDFGWPDERVMERWKKIPGKKYMIMGNHDTRPKEYYKDIIGFDVVSDVPIWLTKRIVLSHEPIPVEDGVINIHGHLHGSSLDFENYVNVSIHVVDYQLYSKRQAEKLLSKLPKPSTKFMEEWFTGHQKFTKEQMARKTDLIFDENGIVLGYKK